MFRNSLSIVLAAMVGVGFVAPVVHAAEKPPTTAPSMAHDPVHEVRRVMAETADRALHKDAVNQVLLMVNKDDRDRLEKEIVKKDDAAYQAVADKVLATWKAKYGKDFSAEGHVDALGDLNVILSGKGKDQTAHISLPAEPGEKAFALHLMREGANNYWRIQLPDTVDGKTFDAKLMAAVQSIEDGKDRLPGAVRKGYERVTTMLLQEMAFPEEPKK